MSTPPNHPASGTSADDGTNSEILAVRDAILAALDPGTGDVPPRKLTLLREALRRCNALAVRHGVDFCDGAPLLESAKDTRGIILAGRQAARAGHHPVSLLLIRPPAGVPAPPALEPVLEVAQRQLRAVGDLARLLEGDRVLAITLESDRGGALAALRRMTRAMADRGIDPGAYEYSLTELDHAVPGEGVVHRVGEGFRPLSIDPERTTPKRVLALDDDPSVLAVIVEQLESSGLDIEVESTTSGYEACIRFGEFEPDLVILDIRMPEIDGRDALSTMKRACGTRDVKFIVASAMPEYFEDMRRRGCDACLQKPFDIDELTDKVSALLGLSSSQQRRAA
jgi:CheY-like chemotaxis protein